MERWDVVDENGNKTGRIAEAGQPLGPGEYHLIVHVWIMNSKGQFLISRRTLNKDPFPGMWETTGGSAVAGEDGLHAAVRETREELGISLDPKKGRSLRRYSCLSGRLHLFIEVWLFQQDISMNEVVLRQEETDAVKLVPSDEMNKMIDEGRFLTREVYPYLDVLFAYC